MKLPIYREEIISFQHHDGCGRGHHTTLQTYRDGMGGGSGQAYGWYQSGDGPVGMHLRYEFNKFPNTITLLCWLLEE